jgi:hypothetical protein
MKEETGNIIPNFKNDRRVIDRLFVLLSDSYACIECVLKSIAHIIVLVLSGIIKNRVFLQKLNT